MPYHSVLDPTDYYRRPGMARRAMTLAPLAPSQDVTRYQAKLMPPPIFDLDRENEPTSLLTILVGALAFAGVGGAIVLIQRVGVWLGP